MLNKRTLIGWPSYFVNLIALALVIAAVTVHFMLGQTAAEMVGFLAILDHLFDLVLALSLCIFMLLVGISLSKSLKLIFTNTAEALCFPLFLGVGCVGLAILLMGLLEQLRPLPVAALMVLSVFVCRRNLRELYRLILGGWRGITLTRERTILSLLFFSLIALLLTRTLTPPFTADELVYHLEMPKQFVKRGSIYPSYDNFFGNLPLLVQMIYTICQMARSDIAAKLISLFLALATSLSLYAFGARFLSRRIGTIALFAFFSAGMIVEVSVTSYIDVSLAGTMFLATYAMMIYLETEHKGWLWVSAILVGFSLGIKTSAALWMPFLGILYLYERMVTKRQNVSSILKYGCAYTLLAVAIASPWYIKNYIWFHNPIYPFITGEVADFGANGIRYFNAEDEKKLEAHYLNARQEIPNVVNEHEKEIRAYLAARIERHPLRLWEFFTKPNSYLHSNPFHLPNYLFLLTPLILFLRPPRWIVWFVVCSIGFVFCGAWSSYIARYLLPAYPPLTITAAYILVALPKRLSSNKRLAESAPVFATAFSLVFIIITSLIWINQFHALHFLSGAISRSTFLLQVGSYRRTDFINKQLPTNTKVIAIANHVNYGINREYLTDESWFSTNWRRLLIRHTSLDELNEELKTQKFTHVITCRGGFTYGASVGIKGSGGYDLLLMNQDRSSELARSFGPEYELLRNWSIFSLYRAKFLKPIYTDNAGCEILEIK
jgi:4-amino-4-deoxy-L-arabinose transferase-like glycosyltransferase